MSRYHLRAMLLPMDEKVDEVLARRVAGETLADLRTVRRELREAGSVRGVIGDQIRAAVERHRRMEARS